MTHHILYNPLAANRQGLNKTEGLKAQLGGAAVAYHSVLEIGSYADFFASLAEGDRVYLCGGDGTLNKFVNQLGDAEIKNDLFFYGAGSGNDFLHDVLNGEGTGPVQINDYIRDLPTVTVNGETYKFVNGIGYGIDGYCCEVGDKQQVEKPGTEVNYAGIAIKGLLFHFKPRAARITVDGETKEYKKVWLAPTMKGRYYGGGMDIAPEQDRLAEDGRVSAVVMYGSGKIKTLVVFPSIFKGEHVNHTEMVEIRAGHEITVEFDQPTALQVDGETILGVTSYTVTAGKAPEKTEAADTTEETAAV